MAHDSDGGEWRSTTDAERIRAWTEERDGVPVRVGRPDGGTDLAVVADPSAVDGEPIGWDEFFDRFAAEGLAFRYREDASLTGTRRACEVVPVEEVAGRDRADEKTTRPDDVESEGMALSDTGEGEPVTYDPVEDDDS